MAECIYRRQGQTFKAWIYIVANPNEKITLTVPDNDAVDEQYLNPFTISDSGKLVITVKKKGTYTIYGSESKITTKVTVSKSRETYEADVSFSATVTVNANYYTTVKFTNYDGDTRQYTAYTDGGTVATVTVRRKGYYYITSTAQKDGTVLSSRPASTSEMNITENKHYGTINHVRLLSVKKINSWVASNYDRTFKMNGELTTENVSDSWNLWTGFAYNIDNVEYIEVDWSQREHTSPSVEYAKSYTLSCSPFFDLNGTRYFGNVVTSSITIWNQAIDKVVKGSSGEVTIPAGIYSIAWFLIGAGGGGGDGRYYNGGGGGGGGWTYGGNRSVSPGDKLSWSIGGGGWANCNGGDTVLYLNGQEICRASGGQGGKVGYSSTAYSIHTHDESCRSGGNGGSGGGYGGHYRQDSDSSYGDKQWGAHSGASKGGSVGYITDSVDHARGGNGCGVEGYVSYNGIWYSGGGGGGGYWSSGGSGGDGGGGSGGSYGSSGGGGNSGASGTGGGGGGGGGNSNRNGSIGGGGAGGSGAAVISYW